MNDIPSNAGLVDTYVSYPIANILSQPLHDVGITPNQVTTFTLLIRIVAIYFLFKRQNRILVFSLFLVSWFTDALDGLMARKYNMTSEFGAHYDYIVDISTTLATLVTLYLQYYSKEKRQFVLLIGTLVILHMMLAIKLRNSPPENLKPWEKLLQNVPIDAQSSIVTIVDPGMTYVVLLVGVFYALFLQP